MPYPMGSGRNENEGIKVNEIKKVIRQGGCISSGRECAATPGRGSDSLGVQVPMLQCMSCTKTCAV